MFARVRRLAENALKRGSDADASAPDAAPPQSRRDARDDAEALAAAVTAISHEIRTPLTTMLGVLRVLGGSNIEPHHARLVETAARAGRQLQAWVDNMADYVAPESLAQRHGGPAERRVADLAEALYAAAESVGVAGRRATVRLEIDAAVSTPRISDARRLRQAVFTMADAVLSAVDHGDFRLIARIRDGDTLVVTLRDAEAVWRPDRRALALDLLGAEEIPDVETLRNGGFALGLAAAQRAARWMGGDLTARPEGGHGLTLELTVAAPVAGALRAGAGAGGRRILVAEDNAVNQRLIQVLLEGLGHAPVIVSGGEEAVRAVDDADFDLILMDLHMPDMDGFAAAEAIRARTDHRAHTPIIALTADVGQDVRDRALAGPMAAFVTKPIELEELAAVIDQVIAAP